MQVPGGTWYPLHAYLGDLFACPVYWMSVALLLLWADLGAAWEGCTCRAGSASSSSSSAAAASSPSAAASAAAFSSSLAAASLSTAAAASPSSAAGSSFLLSAAAASSSSSSSAAASSASSSSAAASSASTVYVFPGVKNGTARLDIAMADSAVTAMLRMAATAVLPGIYDLVFHASRHSILSALTLAGVTEIAGLLYGGWEVGGRGNTYAHQVSVRGEGRVEW